MYDSLKPVVLVGSLQVNNWNIVYCVSLGCYSLILVLDCIESALLVPCSLFVMYFPCIIMFLC
uniref:Uncharacterized protein n=1 Tax=Arundo donax TaxID=35708 RepID=A0A0A9HLM1_ARUDO